VSEVNGILFAVNVAVIILCGGLLSIIPFLTRKSFLFGVKIPLEEHGCPEARSMRKRYVIICLSGMFTILVLAIIQYLVVQGITLIAAMYFPLLFIAVQLWAFVPNWRQALALKKERSWKVSESVFAETKTSFTRGNLSELPWAWYVVTLLLVVGSLLLALGRYPYLPDIIPTHFDINMNPDAWAEKSIIYVIMTPLFGLGTALLMWLVGILFVKARLQIDAQTPELSFTQHRIYRKRVGHSLGFMTLGITISILLFGYVALWPELVVPLWFSLTLMILPIIVFVTVFIRSGQGGCRIKPDMILDATVDNSSSKVLLQDTHGRGDDRFWAIGMFYHNPDDPAYVVEDRFGSNLGFNYSRMPVKIGAVLLGLISIIGYIWLTVWLSSVI